MNGMKKYTQLIHLNFIYTSTAKTSARKLIYLRSINFNKWNNMKNHKFLRLMVKIAIIFKANYSSKTITLKIKLKNLRRMDKMVIKSANKNKQLRNRNQIMERNQKKRKIINF